MQGWRGTGVAVAIVAFAAIFNVAVAIAAPTPVFNYQAQVQSASGGAVTDGTYTVVFRIYDVASDGIALWTETHTMAIEDGLASTTLGTLTPVTLDFNSAAYYLGVTIGSDSELSPRKRMGAVPYAANAKTLDGKSVGTSANNVLGLNSTGGFSLGGTIQTSGDLDVGTSTLDRLTVEGTSSFEQTATFAGDIQGGATTLDTLTVRNGLTLQGGTLSVPAGSVATAALADAAITAAKLAADAVTSGKIADATIVTADLADNAVTAAKLQNNTIDFAQIDDTLTLDDTTTIALAGPNLFYNLSGNSEVMFALDGPTAAFSIEQDDATFLSISDGTVAFTPDTDGALTIEQTIADNSKAIGITLNPSSAGSQSYGIIISQDSDVATTGVHHLLGLSNRHATLAVTDGIVFNDSGGGFTRYISSPNFTVSGTGQVSIGGNSTQGIIDEYYESLAATTIDFADTATATCSAESTITITGAAVGDAVTVTPITTAMAAGTFLNARVSAGDTVSVAFCNLSGGNVDPGSQGYKARIFR